MREGLGNLDQKLRKPDTTVKKLYDDWCKSGGISFGTMVIMLRSELRVHVASSLGLQPCMVNDGIVRG